MASQTAFRAFLSAFQLELGKPVSEATLANLEKTLGFQLPGSVRTCYLTGDGGQSHERRSSLDLLSLKAADSYWRLPRFANSYWGFFPFAESNDSNPVSVCCKSPLAGYVVLVLHDDAPLLRYRSPESFFRTATASVRSGTFLDTHGLPSDFVGPKRRARDRAVARRLIGLATGGDLRTKPERTDALRFACDLLSDVDINEIGALLKDEDEYVREHAAKRLDRVPGPKAKKFLSQFGSDFHAFVEHCARRLQRENIQASVHTSYGKTTIGIEPGPIWLNMEMFYSARAKPDFDAFFLERVRYFIALRKRK